MLLFFKLDIDEDDDDVEAELETDSDAGVGRYSSRVEFARFSYARSVAASASSNSLTRYLSKLNAEPDSWCRILWADRYVW